MNDAIQPQTERLARPADIQIFIRKGKRTQVPLSPANRPVYVPMRERTGATAGVSGVRSYLQLEHC